MEQIKKLAIVIPAYKGRFLKETLDSIAVQAHKDEFVLYIGDDASPERLDKIVESYQNKVNLVYHRFSENMGGKDLVAHWERCIQLSAEPFIWLFSDDDLMPADGVERVMEALSRPHHQRGYFFRFPLAVIDGENKRIRANRPLEEGSVSCYRLLLDKLQGKIDSAAVEYVFSRQVVLFIFLWLGVRMMLRGLLLPVMRGVLFLCRGSLYVGGMLKVQTSVTLPVMTKINCTLLFFS